MMNHPVVKGTSKLIEERLKNSYSYSEYLELVEKLLVEGESTTVDAGAMAEDYVHYSKLGLQRMQRWNKTLKFSQEIKEAIKSHPQKRTWIVLTEGWCGDAAHIMPIFHKMAEINGQIDLRILLREENPELMNEFLTDGAKSIPKLIMYDAVSKEVTGLWGPRPAPAQNIFLHARAHNIDFEVYEQELQIWYNKDKGQTAVEEILPLMQE